MNNTRGVFYGRIKKALFFPLALLLAVGTALLFTACPPPEELGEDSGDDELVKYIDVAEGESIQDAIDSVNENDGYRHVILVAAGTFDESLVIDKRVTIKGAGSDTGGTVIQFTDSPTGEDDPRIVKGFTYSYYPTIQLNVSGTSNDYIALEDLRIRLRQDIIGGEYKLPAILFKPETEISYIKLKNVHIKGTSSYGIPEHGITVDGSTTMENLVVESCEFKDMGYGIIFYNTSKRDTVARYIKITDCNFDNNHIKGFYTEKLSDAVFTGVTVINNGNTDLSPNWAINWNAGIDINLKYGDYQNLTFKDCIVSGNGTGSDNGVGLVVKARGTGGNDHGIEEDPYDENPATLKNVTVDGGEYTANNSYDIRFGEVKGTGEGVGNTSPTSFNVKANVTCDTFQDVVDDE